MTAPAEVTEQLRQALQRQDLPQVSHIVTTAAWGVVNDANREDDRLHEITGQLIAALHAYTAAIDAANNYFNENFNFGNVYLARDASRLVVTLANTFADEVERAAAQLETAWNAYYASLQQLKNEEWWEDTMVGVAMVAAALAVLGVGAATGRF